MWDPLTEDLMPVFGWEFGMYVGPELHELDFSGSEFEFYVDSEDP
jgi:hypothetical protein